MVKQKKAKLVESKEGYDIYACFYDNDTAYLDSFEKGYFSAMIGDLKGKKVLDIGAGTGRLAQEIINKGADYYACDISEEMLKVLSRKTPSAKTKICDARNLDFEDDFFDVVIASFFIVHVAEKDLLNVFDEVYRVLKGGGRFVLSNINQRKPPKLEGEKGEAIVIKSYYHMPRKVVESVEAAFFNIEEEKFVYEDKNWVNQIIKAKK